MGGAVLNWIWLGLILLAVVYGAFTGRMQEVSAASFDGAKQRRPAGDRSHRRHDPHARPDARRDRRRSAARGRARDRAADAPPLPGRPRPSIPRWRAMVMNFATNILGLGNAATPFGLKAMRELETLNPHPGRRERCDGAVPRDQRDGDHAVPADRHDGGARGRGLGSRPRSIWVPTLIATTCSTLTAIVVFYLLRGLPRYAAGPLADAPAAAVRRRGSRRARRPTPALERALARSAAQPAGPLRRALDRQRDRGAAARPRVRGRSAGSRRKPADRGREADAPELALPDADRRACCWSGVAGRVRVYEIDGRGSEGRTRSRSPHPPVSGGDSRGGRDVPRLRGAGPA